MTTTSRATPMPTAAPTHSSAERIMVLWVPDWPVHALREELGHQAASTPVTPATPPLALVVNHRIEACCSLAREAGVRAGMRERDAQAACPALELHPHDPDRDARSFAPVVSALEEVVTGVETRRPGLVALRARGPARYYDGEEHAAHTILARVNTLGFTEARIGIADGLFAAEQAARAPRNAAQDAITVITPGASRAFLAPLPVTRAISGRLVTTLQGLGIHTLGALATLPEDAVRQRFGGEGITAHRRAIAKGPQHGSDVRPRVPPRDIVALVEFDQPLNTGAVLTEAAAAAVARFFTSLAETALICTGLRLELTDDTGARHERTWSHPFRFTAEDVLDRVRWQAESGALAGAQGGEERGGAGVTKLRITPTHTDRAHEAGLWGPEPDDQVRHHLRGIQVARGRDSVGTASLRGGRLAAQRQQFVPWGSGALTAAGSPGLPWPGAAPAPSLVFPEPLPAAFIDATGESVRIDDEDLLVAPPARLGVQSSHITTAAVTAWSTPWPLRERWWAGAPPRVRLQVVLTTGDAWLLIYDTGRWFAEGKYD